MTKITDILVALLKNLFSRHARTLLLCVLFLVLCMAHKAVGAEGDDLLNPPTPPAADPAPAPARPVTPLAKLPAAVQALVDKADADIAKLKEKEIADEGVRRGVLVAALEKAQSDATKKGDLNAALSIKAKLDEQMALLPKKVVPVVKVEAPVPPITGAYKVSGTSWGVTKITLAEKGIAHASNGDAATWRIDKEGALVITWYNGNVNKGKPAAGSFDMDGSGGAGFTLTRE